MGQAYDRAIGDTFSGVYITLGPMFTAANYLCAFGASLSRRACASSGGAVHLGLRSAPCSSIIASNESHFLSLFRPLHFVALLSPMVTLAVSVRAQLACDSITMRFFRHSPSWLRSASGLFFWQRWPNQAFERDAPTSNFVSHLAPWGAPLNFIVRSNSHGRTE